MREDGRSPRGRPPIFASPPPRPPSPLPPLPPPLPPPAPPLFLFTSSVCLPAVSLSLCSYLLSPLSSFRPLFLRRTPFDYPCRPSTLSFLRSPFLLPFVARSHTHSLACSLTHIRSLARSFARPLCRSAPPICKLYPRSPRRLPCLPLSPSVCLASSFPSFIPSRRTPFPLIVLSFFYVPLSPLTFFILLSLPPCPSLSLSLSLSRSLFLLSFFPRWSRPFLSSFSSLRVAPHLSSTAPPSPLFRTLFFFPFAFTLRVSPFRSPFPCSPFESPGTYTLGLFPSIYYPLYHRGGKLVKKYIFYGLQYVDG